MDMPGGANASAARLMAGSAQSHQATNGDVSSGNKWIPMGSALRFIRAHGSAKRETSRSITRSASDKRATSPVSYPHHQHHYPPHQQNHSVNGTSVGSSFGRWLREHLSGGSSSFRSASSPYIGPERYQAQQQPAPLAQRRYHHQPSPPSQQTLMYSSSLPREFQPPQQQVYVPRKLVDRRFSCRTNYHPRAVQARHCHSFSVSANPLAQQQDSCVAAAARRVVVKQDDGQGHRRRHSMSEFHDDHQQYRRHQQQRQQHHQQQIQQQYHQQKQQQQRSRNDVGYRRGARRVPDGAEVVNICKMTELQPSPPGYRGQDEAQQTASPPNPTTQQQILAPQSQLDYNNCDNKVGRRHSANNNHNINNNSYNDAEHLTHPQITAYNENYYKKNAPGYKNDSGYSESIGFDSFSLPLNERDGSSPPPTPPVRDASSLKGVCYGPGHEKYPSWPTANAECRYSDGHDEYDAMTNHHDSGQEHNNHTSGSHRSKSWTEQTSYPKEKLSQHPKPTLAKKPNTSYTQQLKTVLERCEKISPEALESRNRSNMENDKSRAWPGVDHEGKPLGDVEYIVPSPPERESIQTKTLSPTDIEAYVRSYQDPPLSQVDLFRESTLTQAGLEEYTRVQHSQQASYAQSEGYHSYVSSVDSTTTTPFLDRLRRDSEAVTSHRSLSVWDDSCSREGRDSVVTTSSGSASSSETLKWHGSMSDVSVSSGLPPSQSIGSTVGSDRWHHGSLSDVSSLSSGIPPSGKHLLDDYHHHHLRPQNPRDWENSIHGSMSDVSQTTSNGTAANSNSPGLNKQLIAHSAKVQTPQRHHSESVLYLDREKNRKPFPSKQQSSTSVQERISELEKQHQQQQQQQQQQDKRALKVIQKKALLSFYERHQQQQQQQHSTNWKSEPQLSPTSNNRQCSSPPPQPPPRPKEGSNSRRASSASDFSSIAQGWRDRTETTVTKPQHQHSNSCGSLSSSEAVIVGPAISIDDWVPERPPKKPHLRNLVGGAGAADQRNLPSPDLPPPSPPTVTDGEVVSCDQPLPPPPMELDLESQEELKQRQLRSSPLRSSTCRRRKDAAPINGYGASGSSGSSGSTSPKSPLILENGIGKKTNSTEKVTRRSAEERLGPFVTSEQRYGDSGSQRMSHQVPILSAVSQKVEPKIKRQESLKIEDTKQWLEKQQQQQQQKARGPQVPVILTNTSPNSTSSPPSSRTNGLSDSKTNGTAATTNNNNRTVGCASRGLGNRYPQRNHYALPQKFSDHQVTEKSSSTQQNNAENPPTVNGSGQQRSPPPPLAPRLNSATKKSLPPPPRPAPPLSNEQESQSKASYLNYRRERGAPDSEGSYKRTMSPSARLDDPILLKVTPHSPPTMNGHHHSPRYSPNNNKNSIGLNNGNINNNSINGNDTINNNLNNQCYSPPKNNRHENLGRPRDRLSLQSSNSIESSSSSASTTSSSTSTSSMSSLERDRRKFADDICCNGSVGSVTTIEMTSRNVELLNRRNAELRNGVLGMVHTGQDEVQVSKGVDASSQTEILLPSQMVVLPEVRGQRSIEEKCRKDSSGDEGSVNGHENGTMTTQATQTKPRKKLQEEIECEELSRDLANQLGPNDKLLPILVPVPEHKKSTDYVCDLFRVESTPAQSRLRPRLTIEDTTFLEAENGKRVDSMPVTPTITTTDSSNCPLSPTSAYFTISESKARFLTRYNSQQELGSEHEETASTSSSTSSAETLDLRQKKEELVVRLDKKLVVLREEQEAVQEESELNESLGTRVCAKLETVARTTEVSKYRLHVEEVGKITSLLLSLSGRLARAENALYGMPADHPERKIIEGKRDKLADQLEEAKILKGSIDKRGSALGAMLGKYLNDDEFADYQHFINMKAKLIVDSREIQDKVKLGEEQLVALKEAIN